MSGPAEQTAREEHIAMGRAFDLRCRELGIPLDPLLFWYHTVDLGNGMITPGSFDYRATVDHFGLPASMEGMTALDVGSATGFFAFEMERRGASVTSMELPALTLWDHFPGESTSGIVGKIRERLPYHSLLPRPEIAEAFQKMSVSALHRVLLDGPFRFCHERLGSRVERVYSTVYEIGATIGEAARFDAVMLGDILVHTIDPLSALASAASVCGGTLTIAGEVIGSSDDPPAIRYVGGDIAGSDLAEWWRPNLSWFQQVLTRLGFREIETSPIIQGRVRPGGEVFQKRIIWARR